MIYPPTQKTTRSGRKWMWTPELGHSCAVRLMLRRIPLLADSLPTPWPGTVCHEGTWALPMGSIALFVRGPASYLMGVREKLFAGFAEGLD